MFRYYARKSVILQGMVEARKSFLSGMNTYLLKLGAANLGSAYAGKLDRYVAGLLSRPHHPASHAKHCEAAGLRDCGAASGGARAPLHL
jgi:hypothetical protein